MPSCLCQLHVMSSVDGVRSENKSNNSNCSCALKRLKIGGGGGGRKSFTSQEAILSEDENDISDSIRKLISKAEGSNSNFDESKCFGICSSSRNSLGMNSRRDNDTSSTVDASAETLSYFKFRQSINTIEDFEYCCCPTYQVNLALSLFAGYCNEKFTPEFVLQGCHSNANVDKFLSSYALPRYNIVSEAQCRALRDLKHTSNVLLSMCGTAGLWFSPPASPPVNNVDFGMKSDNNSMPLDSFANKLSSNANDNHNNRTPHSTRSSSISSRATNSILEGGLNVDQCSTETVFIIANIEKRIVTIRRSGNFLNTEEQVNPSNAVAEMLNVFRQLLRTSLPPEFCIHSLEDQLQKIYLEGKCLHDLISIREVSLSHGTQILGMNAVNLPLYSAVDEVLRFEEYMEAFSLND